MELLDAEFLILIERVLEVFLVKAVYIHHIHLLHLVVKIISYNRGHVKQLGRHVVHQEERVCVLVMDISAVFIL